MVHNSGFGWEINTGAFGVLGHNYVWEGGGTTTAGGSDKQDPVVRQKIEECWRSFSLALWLPVGISVVWTPTTRIVDEEDPPNTVGIIYEATIKSQCEDLCGSIKKKCLCPYDHHLPLISRSLYAPPEGEVGYKKCERWTLTRFEKMHPLCPPDAKCEPDWEIDPFPRSCPDSPPIELNLTWTSDWDGQDPMPEPPAEVPDSEVWGAMKTLSEVLFAILESLGYNMGCDGGPDIFPPGPQA